jgi:hypothetical protein
MMRCRVQWIHFSTSCSATPCWWISKPTRECHLSRPCSLCCCCVACTYHNNNYHKLLLCPCSPLWASICLRRAGQVLVFRARRTWRSMSAQQHAAAMRSQVSFATRQHVRLLRVTVRIVRAQQHAAATHSHASFGTRQHVVCSDSGSESIAHSMQRQHIHRYA